MACTAVLEQIEACEAANRWRADLPLIIDRDLVSGTWGVEAVSFFCGIAVPLAQLAREAVDVLEGFVDLRWSDVGREARPCAVHDGLVHCCSGGVAHSFVEPQDVAGSSHVESGSVGNFGLGRFGCRCGAYGQG